jgi:hypothetical protein
VAQLNQVVCVRAEHEEVVAVGRAPRHVHIVEPAGQGVAARGASCFLPQVQVISIVPSCLQDELRAERVRSGF